MTNQTNHEPRKVYKLEHFVMDRVSAPVDTPVIWVDHGFRVKGEKHISLAKISDLEALLESERSTLITSIEAALLEHRLVVKDSDQAGKQDWFEAVDIAQVKKILEGFK